MLYLGQDIGCLHPLPTRLLSVADPTATQCCKMGLDHKKKFSCKTPVHIILNGHMLMEQEGKNPRAHSTHLAFIISLKYTKYYRFPA